MKKLIIVLLISLSLIGCTDNQMARKYGGTSTIQISADKKLINLTWKEDNLWILTRARKAGEEAETYEFKEDSSFGVIQGTVIINELPNSTPTNTNTNAK